MKTQQPDWRYVTNLGDADPIDHGGAFIYVDATGVYAPEVELLEPPENQQSWDFPLNGKKANPAFDEDPAEERKPEDIRRVFKWEVRRFCIEPCTYIDGILSNNQFHPGHAAWFAKPERERADRPQDTTYLKALADQFDETVDEFAQRFLSKDVRERAFAWIEVGRYHGFENLDEYPNHYTMAEVELRYKDELKIESDRTCRGEHKTFQKVWTHHPRGGFITGFCSDLKPGLYSPERTIAPSIEAAVCGLGVSVPDSQVYLGEPPSTL